MNNNQIGERIRALRKQHHISQKELYEATGISSGNLNSMETGKTLPSSNSLIALAKLFQCSTDYILFGSMENTDTPYEVFVNEEEQKLLNRYRKMDQRSQEEVQLFVYIKSLSELPSDI